MMVELLGTRIIGPYYGVSLIVWSSLLSVSLLALAVGYYFGGVLADRKTIFRLPHAVFFAAVTISLIPLVSEAVQIFCNPLGLRFGALSSAFILFTPCLVFLGMAGPFVIQMATQQVEDVGSTSGSVYAISTVGSVFGTLLLGFFLLPLFGTHAILLVLSLLLACLAFGLAIYTNIHRRFSVATLAVVVFVGGSAVWQLQNGARGGAMQGYEVLFEQETHYGWVRVVDQPKKNIRWLMSDASTIGAEDNRSGRGLLAYQAVVRLLPWFKPGAKKALLVGLGAGHLVGDFQRYGVQTDAIEIDPAVAHAAREFFDFQPTGKVLVGDARYRIKQLDEQYDLIVHDCFTGGAEPFHLLSQEMIGELKTKLKPGGILAVNFVGFTEAEKLKPVKSIALTLDQNFAYRKTYVAMPEEPFNDFIFMVSDAPVLLSEHPAAENVAHWLAPREFHINAEGGELITDDYNPLEYLQMAKAEHYRDVLVARVGESILFR